MHKVISHHLNIKSLLYLFIISYLLDRQNGPNLSHLVFLKKVYIADLWLTGGNILSVYYHSVVTYNSAFLIRCSGPAPKKVLSKFQRLHKAVHKLLLMREGRYIKYFFYVISKIPQICSK